MEKALRFPSGQDEGVGEEDGQDGGSQVEAHHDEHPQLVGCGIRAGEREERRPLAVEVVDDVGAAEAEPEGQACVEGGVGDPSQTGAGHQEHADPSGHEEGVEQGVADGYVAVIGHGGQEVALGGGEGHVEIELREAHA